MTIAHPELLLRWAKNSLTSPLTQILKKRNTTLSYSTYSMSIIPAAEYSDKIYQIISSLKWTAMSENVPSDMYAQQRFRSDCVFAQSDQNLCWVNSRHQRMQSFFLLRMTLIRLHRCAGWFVSSLGARKVHFLTIQLECYLHCLRHPGIIC